MITVYKNGVKMNYNSLQEIAREIGITSPISAKNLMPKLEANGYDLNTYVNDKPARSSNGKGSSKVNATSHVQALLKSLAVKDTEAIKATEAELLETIKNFKVKEDMKKVHEIQAKLAELESPSVTLEALVKLVTNEYNKINETTTETIEEETEQ